MDYFGTHRVDSPEQSYQWQPGEWAHAISSGKFIGINPNYYGDNKLFIKDIQKAETVGWHPKGCNNIESVLTHEFGHQVMNWLISNDDYRWLTLDFIDRNFSEETAATVSRYACKNVQETWAESFAAIYHGNQEIDLVEKLKNFLEDLPGLVL